MFNTRSQDNIFIFNYKFHILTKNQIQNDSIIKIDNMNYYFIPQKIIICQHKFMHKTNSSKHRFRSTIKTKKSTIHRIVSQIRKFIEKNPNNPQKHVCVSHIDNGRTVVLRGPPVVVMCVKSEGARRGCG